MKLVKNAKLEAMSENVKYYFKKDCTERCPHIKDEPEIGSPYCLHACKHNIKIDCDSGWIICEKLNEEAWRKKSEELICKLPFYAMELARAGKMFDFGYDVDTSLIESLNICKNFNQTLNKMKKENINIEIPEGYVPEIKDGKVTLVYKGYPLDEMPKNWEELGRIGGEYIKSDSIIHILQHNELALPYNKNIIPRGLGEPILALIQLLQLRNRTWEVTNSKPTRDCPWVIAYNSLSDTLERFTSSTNHSMKFSSEVVTLKFLELHKDLLWEARELL